MAFKELRFFGRRKGKAINNSRQMLLDNMLPKLKPTLPSEGQTFDFNTLFGITPKEVWLEVGFGGGEHVAELAKMYPDVGIIGAEPFLNGVVSLLAHLNGSHTGESTHTDLEEGRTDNVRIWPDDVRQMFPHFKIIPLNGCLYCIRIRGQRPDMPNDALLIRPICIICIG